MSFRVQLVRSWSGTFLGKEIKLFCLRLGKRRLAFRFAQLLKSDLSLALTPALAHIIGQMATRARSLYPRFLAKYPFLAKFEERAWVESVSQALAEGGTEMTTLRGKIVERFIPDMPEMKILLTDMTKLAKSKGWKEPRLISGLHTQDGNEIADWVIAAEHEDGRLWIMSIIESKSVSNRIDLASHKERGVGQHLWDFIRMRTEKLYLNGPDGKAIEYLPTKVVVNPVPKGYPPPSHGLVTELVGVTPKKLTKGQLQKISGQFLDLKQWHWPVDEDDLGNMIDELRRAFDLPPAN